MYLFHYFKRLTGGKHLWLRNNASTMVSQFVDSVAVILATHFIADALLGERYSARYSVLHTDLKSPGFALVPHASLTTLVRRADEWVLESWAEPTVSTGVENGDDASDGGGGGSSL